MDRESNLYNTYLRPKQEAHVRVGKNYQACIPELSLPTHVDKIKIYNTIMKLDDFSKIEKINDDKIKIYNHFNQEEIFTPTKKRKLDL
jgi:hypothetical protein